ncbi:YhdP family protein [Motilimonas pumila]|uniref:TIGR02099 family protein n=1 Tax=Motilimonas pumila TaxID=2303987 RepID=A0A418YHY0_9GAMM|nr:YhdP family protein [Motilimonas pumila]RJG49990.1 TIGR02099 family protein [Motilimonas pumila]
MKQFSLRWLRRFWISLAVILVLLAVAASLFRGLLPLMNAYKDDITYWLVDQHDIDISVDSLDASWDRHGPALVINQTHFNQDPHAPFELSIRETRLRLDLWASIEKQTPVFHRIELSGVELEVKPENGDSEANNAVKGKSLSKEGIARLFLSDLSVFSLTDSQIAFYPLAGVKQTIAIESLNWLNEGARHQGVGKASLIDTSNLNLSQDSLLSFKVELNGEDTQQYQDWPGLIYVEAKDLNLAPLLASVLPTDNSLVTGEVNFKAWADFTFGNLLQAQLVFEPTRLTWQQAKDEGEFLIESGHLTWWPTHEGWQLDSHQLQVVTNQQQWRDFDIQAYQADNLIVAQADTIAVNALVPLAKLFGRPSSKVQQALDSLNLQGQLSHISLLYNTDSPDFAVRAMIDDLSAHYWQGIPDFQQARWEFLAEPGKGQSLFSLQGQTLDFKQHFNQPMRVDELALPLHWRVGDKQFQVFSPGAEFNNPDLSWLGQFALTFEPGLSPHLALYSEAHVNDAEEAEHYLPIQAMGEGVYRYLQPTIKAGKVETAKILWHGYFADFPYQDGSGVFQAFVPLERAEYAFFPGWPALSDMRLDLLFQNDGLWMTSPKAKLLGLTTSSIKGVIERFSPDVPLTIAAKLTGMGDEIREYIDASPLQDSVGKALNAITVNGEIVAELDLTIPLNGDQTLATGKINLDHNQVSLPLNDAGSERLLLNNVSGSFEFEQGNLANGDVNAELFNQPIKVLFEGQQLDQGYRSQIDLSAQWRWPSIYQSWPNLHILEASGEFNWDADISYQVQHDGNYKLDLSMSSDLLGSELGLPAPFNKNSLKKWPLSVSAHSQSQQLNLSVELANKVYFNSVIDQVNSAKNRYWLHLGRHLPNRMPAQQQAITLNYNRLDIGAWLNHLKDKQDRLASSSAASNPNNKPFFKPQHFDFYVTHADLLGQPLEQLKVTLKKNAQQWFAQLNAEQLQGTISTSDDKLTVNFQKLDLPQLDFALWQPEEANVVENQSKASKAMTYDWRALPNIDLTCLQCRFGDLDFGRVSGKYQKTAQAGALETLTFSYPHSNVNITGFWSGYKARQQTSLDIAIDSRDVDKLVQSQGYRSPMRQTPVSLTGKLAWQGAPMAFSTATLSGDLSFKTEAGYVADVSDKGARLFSLLSLDSLRRKLNLDFRDVFAEGLYFDSMGGSATIKNGLVSNQDFVFDGGAGRLEGAGTADLNEWQIDYRMAFYPDVTSSLPVLAAFTLTPVTGLYVLLVSKLLEPVVDTITEINFSLTGDLSSPELKEVGRQQGEVTVPEKIRDSYEKRISDSVNKLQRTP